MYCDPNEEEDEEELPYDPDNPFEVIDWWLEDDEKDDNFDD